MTFFKEEIDIIKNIPPTNYETYLKSKNWVKIGIIDKNTASVWEFEKKRITVPLDPLLADYSNVLVSILLNLEEIENRTFDSIISDLEQIDVDVLKIITNKRFLSLKDTSILINNSINLISSATQSIITQKPYFKARYKEVSEVLNNFNIGYTEKGNFIMNIYTNISKGLFQDSCNIESEPFHRQVMIKLSTLLSIAIDAANRGDFNPFGEAVSKGISANFCEALSEITKICVGDDNVAILNITWAPIRPVGKSLNLENNFVIRKDMTGIFEEVSKHLRVTPTKKDKGKTTRGNKRAFSL